MKTHLLMQGYLQQPGLLQAQEGGTTTAASAPAQSTPPVASVNGLSDEGAQRERKRRFKEVKEAAPAVCIC